MLRTATYKFFYSIKFNFLLFQTWKEKVEGKLKCKWMITNVPKFYAQNDYKLILNYTFKTHWTCLKWVFQVAIKHLTQKKHIYFKTLCISTGNSVAKQKNLKYSYWWIYI